MFLTVVIEAVAVLLFYSISFTHREKTQTATPNLVERSFKFNNDCVADSMEIFTSVEAEIPFGKEEERQMLLLPLL